MPVEAGGRRERGHPRLAGLADLVDHVVACLDRTGEPRGEPLRAAVDRCTTELEAYLELERVREPHPIAAQDELRGLARQLRADRGDATAVVRRVRRILGRVDAERRGG